MQFQTKRRQTLGLLFIFLICKARDYNTPFDQRKTKFLVYKMKVKLLTTTNLAFQVAFLLIVFNNKLIEYFYVWRMMKIYIIASASFKFKC